jgi:antitoxin VapB
MASLFIKNNEAAELAAEVAELRGVTKTAAVVDALRKERDALRPPAAKVDLLKWIEDYRREHPLPPPTGKKADKAFFDELWGEED